MFVAYFLKVYAHMLVKILLLVEILTTLLCITSFKCNFHKVICWKINTQ